MNLNIFAVKDGKVQVFYVIMDEQKIRDIQSRIDDWSGKGEIKEVTAHLISDHFQPDKKIEVISETYAGRGEAFYYCCPSVEQVDMYNFKFYQYKPHPLSSLCDTLLRDCDSLDFSQNIEKLLNWSSQNVEEMSFVIELISVFKFKKSGLETIEKNDLAVAEKRNVLESIATIIKSIVYSRNFVVPSLYEEAVDRNIYRLECYYSGFYARELGGKDFHFTKVQRGSIKKKILKRLPSLDCINTEE